MFAVNRKVVYPIYGAGKIIDRYETDFQGEKTEYYKVEFFDSRLTISIPVEKAEKLGLRYPLSERKLKEALRAIGKKVRFDSKKANIVNDEVEEMILSGSVEDVIEGYNILKAYQRYCSKEEKPVSMATTQLIEKISTYLRSEIKEVLGESALDKYEIG